MSAFDLAFVEKGGLLFKIVSDPSQTNMGLLMKSSEGKTLGKIVNCKLTKKLTPIYSVGSLESEIVPCGSTQVNLEVSMPKLDHAEKIYAGQWIFATGNGLISHLPMSYQGEPLGQALETSLPGQPTVLVKVMS